MVQAAYEQIGLAQKKPPSKAATAEQMLQQYSDGVTSYFHVSQAINSPYMPGQEFVKQYGIQSVVGVGCPFLSGAFYFMLAFAQSPISQPAAATSAELTAPFSTLLALRDFAPLWMSEKGADL